MHTINTPPHIHISHTTAHSYLLSLQANSPLTVESYLELFFRVFLNAVFYDDLAKNVCMAIALSADTC